jgi:pectin methylesterase-like acyl-CoA thioesterase
VFNKCTIRAAEGVEKLYLGRPWRDYGYTLFMNCDLCKEIRPEGWHHWEEHREKTARYMEYNNFGEGAATDKRVSWSHQLSKKEAATITLENVFNMSSNWLPVRK